MVDFNEMFEYRKGKLFNKIDRGVSKVGEESGHLHKSSGYKVVKVLGTSYTQHRVIWEMMRGVIPSGYEIDHIDQNKLNNRISNLRAVSHKDNMKNSPINSRNTSGVMGVWWRKNRSRWVAQVKDGNKSLITKHFKNKEEAEVFVKAYRKSVGFHDNHGGTV